MIEHIFFDLDHTLWDFEKNSRETLEDIFAETKLAERNISFGDFWRTYNLINDKLWQEYRNGKVYKKELRRARFIKTLQSFRVNDTSIANFFISEYTQRAPLKKHLIPGTPEMLAELKNKGYRMHIITNGFKETQHIKLKGSGLTPFFENVITSDEVGINKPNPKIFHFALRAADARQRKSLMVGDQLQTDIIGARRAGMKQAYFNPLGIPHNEKVTFEIKALNMLPPLIGNDR